MTCSRFALVAGVIAWLAAPELTAQLPTNAAPSGVSRAARPDSQERPRAVTHSDRYYVMLKIHRIGSYAVLPLFAMQYIAGEQLIKTDPPGWARPVHTTGAATLGVLFGTNTVTGLWNLWETRHEAPGRTRRIVHTTLMLIADAGFVWSAATTPEDAEDEGEGEPGSGRERLSQHRAIAVTSMGVAAVSTVMMWLWK